MILISYPSGGFGNFLFHVLTEFSSNTYKPGNSDFKFDLVGRSHDTKKYTPIYHHDPVHYTVSLPQTDKECLILCDNGIDNDSYEKINQVFTNARIIRVCIDHAVRPVVYKTCVTKAQNSDTISETINQVGGNWGDIEDFSIRENFTLLYHNWPFSWTQKQNCINVSLEALIQNPIETNKHLIGLIGGEVLDSNRLVDICESWKKSNQKYFKVYCDWQRIESALDSNSHIDLTDITDLHDQGYINYCLEKKFNYTIPVYDYRNWFKSTEEIPLVL